MQFDWWGRPHLQLLNSDSMITHSMASSWGRKRALEMLFDIGAWLTAECKRGHYHISLARHAGSIAAIVDVPSVTDVVTHVLGSAPDSAFSSGVISNIGDLSRLSRRTPPTFEEAEESFPAYATDVVRRTLESVTEPHVQLVLNGDIAGGLDHASDDLAMEEYASSCAVTGHLAACLRVIEKSEFPSNRVIGPLIVSCIEAFRAGNTEQAEGLLRMVLAQRSSTPWIKIHLCAGLLDRMPWPGYPYPDY